MTSSRSTSPSTLITAIPVYNGERFIRATLESIAAQTRRPDRVVVLDNGSSDATREIVAKFTPLQSEWRQNETNLGLFGNLNRALELATETEHLHLLHADDLIAPRFYERQLAALGQANGHALGYCLSRFIDKTGKPTSFLSKNGTRPEEPSDAAAFIRYRAELRPVYSPSVLLKTAARPSPCQFRLDFPQLADLIFWADFVRHARQQIEIPETLAQYRVHPESETGRNAARVDAWITEEWRAMQIILQWEPASPLAKYFRREKLKCLLAARSHVKIQLLEQTNPDALPQVERATRQFISKTHWVLGRWAVRLRDARVSAKKERS